MNAIDHGFVAGDGIYLLNHSVGRPPAAARDAVARRFFAPWERGDGEPWGEWLAAVEDFRAALAALFATKAENFCPQTNLSSALSKIVSAVPMRPRRNILLLSEDDFPSLGFVLQQAERLGYRTRFIPASEAITDPSTWQRHFTADVGLALLTHVQSNTSRMLPIETVAHLAREREVFTVVDVAQSAGVIPIAIDRLNADFVIGSCVKWLCGGPGAAFLWANPVIVGACEPIDVGWFSHAEPFAMRIRDFRYHPGVLRFWGGTPSVLPAALAAEGVRTLAEIGTAAVRAHNLALSAALIDAATAAAGEGALRSPRDAAERGGTVVLNFGDRQTAIVERLRAAKVRFDTRATGMRLSPHVYNTAAEVQAVCACFG